MLIWLRTETLGSLVARLFQMLWVPWSTVEALQDKMLFETPCDLL